MKCYVKVLFVSMLIVVVMVVLVQVEIGCYIFKVLNGVVEDYLVLVGIKGMLECLVGKIDGKMKLCGFYNGELGDDVEVM